MESGLQPLDEEVCLWHFKNPVKRRNRGCRSDYPRRVKGPHEHQWIEGHGTQCALPLSGLDSSSHAEVVDAFCARTRRHAEFAYPYALTVFSEEEETAREIRRAYRVDVDWQQKPPPVTLPKLEDQAPLGELRDDEILVGVIAALAHRLTTPHPYRTVETASVPDFDVFGALLTLRGLNRWAGQLG